MAPKEKNNYEDVIDEYSEVLSDKYDTKLVNHGPVYYEGRKHYFYSARLDKKGVLTPTAIIRAGAHGEEFDGTHALLKLLEEEEDLVNNFSMLIFPCGNPWGYVYGTRNVMIESNKFFNEKVAPHTVHYVRKKIKGAVDIAIDLHGDNRDEGFYIYQRKRVGLPDLAKKTVAQVKKKFPVTRTKVIDGDKIIKGVINCSGQKEGTFEEHCYDKGAKYSFTPEFAGWISQKKRIDCGYLLLKYLLSSYFQFVKR